MNLSDQQIKALLASELGYEVLKNAGYSPAELLAAGYSTAERRLKEIK